MYLSSIQTHTGCISRILASICAILRQSSSAASTSAHLASLRDPVLRARCIARCISRSTLLSRAMPAVDNRCWMHRVKAPLFGGLTFMSRMAGKNLSRKKSSFLRFRFLLFCGAYFVFCKNLFLVQKFVSFVSVPGFQFGPVTVSFEAFSVHKTMMYTMKVVFTIVNNLIQHRGLDCHLIIQTVSRN